MLLMFIVVETVTRVEPRNLSKVDDTPYKYQRKLERESYCDGYSGYNKLDNVTLFGCLAHAKKFHEIWKVNQSNEKATRGE